MATDDFVQVAPDSTGKKIRTIRNTVGANDVDAQVVTLSKNDGTILDAMPVTDNGGSITVDGTVAVSGTVPVSGPVTDAQLRATAVPVSLASQPLPGGAATEATLGNIEGFTDLAAAGIGAVGDTEVSGAGNASAIAILKRLRTLLSGTVATSLASQPLPTGAATEATLAAQSAKLPAALGAGGGMKVDGSGTALPISGTVAVSGSVATTGPLTDTQLRATAVPVSGTVAVSGTLPVSNAGTFAVQDSEKVADNAAFTDGTTKVMASGHIFDEVAGTALTENDIAASRIDSKRAQVGVIEDATTRGQRLAITAANAAKVDGSAVTQPVSGTVTVNDPTDCTTYHLISAATTNANNVKASAGKLYGWTIGNNGAAAAYVKLHNTAGTPTAGAAVVKTIMIPAGGASNMPVNARALKAFAAGIGISITGGMADADTTAVALAQVSVELYII